MLLAAKKTGPDPHSLLGWHILAPLTALLLVLIILFGLAARHFFEPQALESDLQRAERDAGTSAVVFSERLPQRSSDEILEDFRTAGMDNMQFLPPSQTPSWSSPRFFSAGSHVEAWAPVKDAAGSIVGAVAIRRKAEAMIFTGHAIKAFGAAACLSYALLALTGWFLLKRRVSKRLAAIVDDVDPAGQLQLDGRDAVERVRDAVAKTSAETSARERHLLRLLDGHTELACLATPEGKLLDVNRAYCRFFGKERGELIGTNCLDLVHPSFRMDVVNRLQSVSGTRAETELLHAVTRQDGGTSWLRWRATATPSADGSGTEILSFRTDVTAQIAKEEQLAALQRAFDQMQSLAETGSITWDFADDRMEWTPEARRLLGAAATPSLQGLIDAVAPDDRETVRALFLAAKKEGTDFNYEFRVNHADGSVRFLQSRAEVLADPKTKLLNYLTCTLRDITALRRAEESTKRELQFRQAIESSLAAGIVVRDAHGRTVSANPAFCRMTGFTEDELKAALPPNDPYWPEEEKPRILEALQQTLDGSVPPGGFEFVFCRKDGTRFDVLVKVAPLLSAERAQLGWLGAVTDVSAIQGIRRQLTATQSALRSELRFREAFEQSLGVGIVAIDDNARVLSINRAFCELVGLPDDKIIGLLPPYPWWPKDDHAGISAALRNAVEGTAPPAGFTLCFQHNSGRLFDVLIKVAPLLDSEGKRIGWLSSITDVTRIVETQRKLEAAEGALLEQLALREAVEKSTNVGLISIGGDGRPLYANEAFCKMVDYTQEEVLAFSPPYPYWPEAEREKIQQAFDQHLAGRTPAEGFQLQFQRKNGELFDVLVTATDLPASGKRPAAVLSSITDISAIKRTERTIVEINERLRLAQDAAEIGLWDWNPTSDTLFWDRNSFAMFGHAEATDPKAVWDAALAPEVREQLTYDLNRLIAKGGTSGQDRLTVRWPDKSIHEILSTYIIHRDSSDRATRVIGVNRDVTSEIEKKSELRDTRDRLVAALDGADFGTFEHIIGVGDLNWNSANYEINGIDPSITDPAELFAAWKEVVGDIYPKLMEQMGSLPITTNRYSYELTAAPPNREPRRVRVSVFIERNERGHPTRLVGVTRRAEN